MVLHCYSLILRFVVLFLLSLKNEKEKKKEKCKYLSAPVVLDVLIEQTWCSNKYCIIYINSPIKSNALALIIHCLFTECFSWVPHFIICGAETLDSTASWNDSSAIKMHCQKSWNHSQISWCKTFKGLYGVPVQMDFSLQCTLILSGSGRRYQLPVSKVLVLTANKEWLSLESSHGWVLCG